MREVLAKSIHLFPENSLFHEVQSLISAHNRVDDRLRDALQTGAGQRAEMGIIGWCYAVAKEVERCNVDGSGATANSMRALFSKALLASDSGVKQSPLLWRLWFRFERILAESVETSSTSMIAQRAIDRVKQIFYDGLRHLPWCNFWIIMGMRLLAQHQGSSERELHQLYDVMMEREMRIRIEIES